MIQNNVQEKKQQQKIIRQPQIIDLVEPEQTEIVDKDLLKLKQLWTIIKNLYILDEKNYYEAFAEIEEKIKENELLKDNKKNDEELLMHKSNILLFNQDVVLLIRLDEYAEALECVNKALAINPENIQLHYLKGIALFDVELLK